MRSIFFILGGLALFALLVTYLFRGFGPEETGALFREAHPLPVRYFETPENAVRRIDGLLTSGDWRTLTQFYELEGSTVAQSQLLDGSFFLQDGARPDDLRSYLHPFPPGARFYAVQREEESDIFVVDVVWQMDQPWEKGQKHLTQFKMRRHPEGYRLLPERVVTRPLEGPSP